MRKAAALVLLTVFTAAASAVTLNGFETYSGGEEKDVFDSSQTAEFRLNVTDNQDYNITVRDADGAVVVDSEEMQLASSGYYKIYEYDLSFDSGTAGTWTATVNYTAGGEETIAETDLHLASPTPGFYDLNAPEYARQGDNASIKVKITDSDDDVSGVSIKSDGRSEQLSRQSSSDLYDVYAGDAYVDDLKENSFELEADDSAGNTGSTSFEIYGYRDDESGSEFSVKVEDSCSIVATDFYAPGNGTLFLGQVGDATLVLGNQGSVQGNATVEYLNFTYENQTEWEQGDSVGEVVQSYDGDNVSFLRSGQKFTYAEEFTNSNRSGYYTARAGYSAECEIDGNRQTLSNDVYRTFSVVNASGGVSQSGNQSTNETIASNASDISDKRTNLTYPSNVSDVANEDTNQTLERDANRTGEQGQNVEGDNQQPGVTPQPQPQPEPEPIPALSLDIESVDPRYEGRRGGAITANLSLSNEGSEPLQDLTISPQIQKLREGWTSSNAKVSSLEPNQTVTRQVIVTPPETADPGLYVVPVVGSNADRRLDVDYFTVEVTEEPVFASAMQIQEAPSSLNVEQNRSLELPVLINNTGEKPLEDITAELQNAGECGEASVDGVSSISPNSSASLGIQFDAAQTTQTCNTTLIVSSADGAYSFTDISFTVRPEEGLIPREYEVPFAAFAWTALLVAFAVMRKRFDPQSILFKAPYVLTVSGEVLIFIYLVVDYYQLVSLAFLPF